MSLNQWIKLSALLVFSQLLTACGDNSAVNSNGDADQAPPAASASQDAPVKPVTAFTGAVIIDGAGSEPVRDGVLLVSEGRIQTVGSATDISVPGNARLVDVSGAYMVPGFINAHGHVGTSDGLETGPAVHTRENVLSQLALYARYGITTVVSLDDPGVETVRLRVEQDTPELSRARIYTSGPYISPTSLQEAASDVAAIAAMDADWVKIRVDDGLGTQEKMSPEIYAAVISESHERGLPVAAHIVYLEDAKGVVRHGADLVAHSVRDLPVDQELIEMMRQDDVCITPTLTRELSVFVYAERPDFFDDPFFLAEVDEEILEELQEPARQAAVRSSRQAEFFREALPLALQNTVDLHEGGVGIAMGTDSGVPGRFQGYFEHLEMEMMQEGGMSAEDVFLASTGEAARCMGLTDVGTLQAGNWADFVLLEENPLEDIRAARSILEVYVAGNIVNR